MQVTVSWIRAYHTRRLEKASEIVERLEAAGLVTADDDFQIAFFDIQALRASHFGSATGLRLTIQLDGSEAPLVVRSHLIAHASGFIVCRLTLSSVDNPAMTGWGPAELAVLERMPWNGAPVAWTVRDNHFTGSLRGCMNALFLACHEQMMRGGYDFATILAYAEDGPGGNDRLQELATRGELSHPLPVSFGTHIEIGGTSWDRDVRDAYVDEILSAASGGESWASDGHVVQNVGDPWYVFENQSIVFVEEAGDPDGGVLEPDRLRLLEFLTLRRGAMRSIQRDTQRVLTGGADVSRRRIDEWRLLLATTTDDYVLHDRISRLLVPLAAHQRDSPAVRNPERLEAQVRTNIESFHARVELASQSVSSVIGALFAVVAAVLGVGAILKLFVAGQLHLGDEELSEAYPWISSGIDILVMALAFVFTWLLIRRASARVPALRPYTSARERLRRRQSARS